MKVLGNHTLPLTQKTTHGTSCATKAKRAERTQAVTTIYLALGVDKATAARLSDRTTRLKSVSNKPTPMDIDDCSNDTSTPMQIDSPQKAKVRFPTLNKYPQPMDLDSPKKLYPKPMDTSESPLKEQPPSARLPLPPIQSSSNPMNPLLSQAPPRPIAKAHRRLLGKQSFSGPKLPVVTRVEKAAQAAIGPITGAKRNLFLPKAEAPVIARPIPTKTAKGSYEV